MAYIQNKLLQLKSNVTPPECCDQDPNQVALYFFIYGVLFSYFLLLLFAVLKDKTTFKMWSLVWSYRPFWSLTRRYYIFLSFFLSFFLSQWLLILFSQFFLKFYSPLIKHHTSRSTFVSKILWYSEVSWWSSLTKLSTACLICLAYNPYGLCKFYCWS